MTTADQRTEYKLYNRDSKLIGASLMWAADPPEYIVWRGQLFRLTLECKITWAKSNSTKAYICVSDNVTILDDERVRIH